MSVLHPRGGILFLLTKSGNGINGDDKDEILRLVGIDTFNNSGDNAPLATSMPVDTANPSDTKSLANSIFADAGETGRLERNDWL